MWAGVGRSGERGNRHTHSLIRSLTHSLTHSLARSLAHLHSLHHFTPLHSALTHALTCSHSPYSFVLALHESRALLIRCVSKRTAPSAVGVPSVHLDMCAQVARVSNGTQRRLRRRTHCGCIALFVFAFFALFCVCSRPRFVLCRLARVRACGGAQLTNSHLSRASFLCFNSPSYFEILRSPAHHVQLSGKCLCVPSCACVPVCQCLLCIYCRLFACLIVIAHDELSFFCHFASPDA